MEQLISKTAAYKIFAGDKRADRLSHAYMLYFNDAANLRTALKMFALVFFGDDKSGRNKRLIESEGLVDLKIYPKADKKLTVDVAAEITDDAYLKPVEGDRKLYIISGFEEASALFQNKLLKILEEPPAGVYFLLGALSLAPVLDTVKSRVKTLQIPPFSVEDIFSALQRESESEDNRRFAEACGGVLGAARAMKEQTWFAQVDAAAQEICSASTVPQAVAAAIRYGDTKYKTELLTQMQRIYFSELEKYAKDENYCGKLAKGTLIYAVECVNKALTDVKFNANVSSLLYDLTLKIALENEKW